MITRESVVRLPAGVLLVILFLLSAATPAMAQRKIINLPDIPGYVTLKCDFHLHTVFSDGTIWPTMRIDEAVRDGLDAIAITDHLGASARKEFIPPDDDAGWKIGEQYAKERNLILVHGTEITGRQMPPGHFNALFIKNASALPRDDVWGSLEAAARQGAFVQWNHPGWKAQQPDGIPKIYDIHERLIAKGYLHGIEVFNHSDSYPVVLDMCREHKLAVMGNSDNHTVISEAYPKPQNINRPMTLVLAKERNHDALKEALFAGRTLVWFRDTLAGKEEYARPFFYECVTTGRPFFQNSRNVFFEVTNACDIPFILVNGPPKAPPSVVLAANSRTRMVIAKNLSLPLTYDVKNVLTGGKDVLRIEIKP